MDRRAADVVAAERASIPSLVLETAARAAHEVNRVWCLAHGDDSQCDWDESPDWQRESARAGVLGVLRGRSPEQSHAGWLEHKQNEGWVYGPTKDVARKEHPCMLPYDELSPVQREKDRLFVGTVTLILRGFGFEVSSGEEVRRG